MSAPTFNKYRSTTIYGALNVRDFTNSAGTSVIEVASTDLSGNFISRGDSTFTKAVVCNGTISNSNHLTTKSYVDTAVSGGGGSILGLNNTFTGTNIFNNNVDISGNFTSRGNIDLSGNFISRGSSNTFNKKVICNANIEDLNTGSCLTTKEYVITYLGEQVLNLRVANNTWSGLNEFYNYFPICVLPTSTTINGYTIVNKQMNDILYSSKTNEVKTNTANDFTSTNSFNSNFPTSTLPTSTSITNDSIVNKGMNDTLYSSVANQVKTNTANAFTSTNTFNSNFPSSTLPTSTTITTNSIVNKGMNDTLYSSVANEVKTNTDNTYTGQNIYSNNLYCNSILDVRKTQVFPSSFRVSMGDIDNPTLPTASSEQYKQVGGLTITQASTSQTETIDYITDNSVITSYTIPINFSKNITFNIPIGISNTGTAVLSGTASSFTITNLFNSFQAKIYVNDILITTTSSPTYLFIQNSNSNTRSSTISYTSTGTKTINLNQYFFNLFIDLTEYLDNDYFVRDNGITNILKVVLKANITNTLTKVSNTGNFTTTINTSLIANTTTSTYTASLGTNGTATYSPNSNGTGYAIASFQSVYLTLFDYTGTTYSNYLRINKLYVKNDIEVNGDTIIGGTTNLEGVVNHYDSTYFTGTINSFKSILLDNQADPAEFTIANAGYIKQTGTAVNTLNNLKLDGGILTQLNNTSTNTLKNLQVDTIATIPEILTNTSQSYLSLKMRNYIFHSRNTTTASGITLSTNTYIDDGQYLYVRKINTGSYTLTLTAGTSTTFLNLSNASVSTIAITNLLGVSFIYDKTNTRWIQLT
jgi:hypothetical protein